jgi:hydroxyethylthiazole kinase-like uncharacterized protein yjeF
VQPVLTVAEMRAVDARALEREPLEVLVARAGREVAREAVSMLGGAYGRRVVVVAGRGHNGDDGRVAARLLARRGARVVLRPPRGSDPLPSADLVVDAAVGTGFHGEYESPAMAPGTRVLAVDLPSGLDADTGAAGPGVAPAERTVTFGALKPGLLLGSGPRLAGTVRVARLGLPLEAAQGVAPSVLLIEDGDVAERLPRRARDGQKWDHAVALVAGSPGMLGAATFAAAGAQRAGSGMVRWLCPGVPPDRLPPSEAVVRPASADGFDRDALEELPRVRAAVVGPGLGRAAATCAAVRRLVASAPVPLVLDADALFALGPRDDAVGVLRSRPAPTVLTPHDGELARLTGSPPGADRVGEVRRLAAELGAVVLLKGPTTVVAAPDGEVLLAAAGSARLSTAGTGDVLSGVVGAFLARGLGPLLAAALAAHVHGLAGERGLAEGLVASDLPRLVAEVLSQLCGDAGAPPGAAPGSRR